MIDPGTSSAVSERRLHLAAAILAAGLLIGTTLLMAAGTARAIECTDFPAGNAINWPDLGAETDVDIAYDSQGVLHAVWLSGPAPAASADVYYARSTDGGQSFVPSVKVNWSDRTAARMSPMIDVDPGGTIHVAWTDERAGWPDLDIYFSKSTDGGLSFTQEVRVNDWTQDEQSRVAIRVTPAGTVYAGWISHIPADHPTVRITRSVGGLPFEASRQVNGGPIGTSCECCNIDIVSVGEQQVLVAFMANLDYIRDLFVSRSTDGGWTFADPVQVNDGHWYVPACPSSGPRLELGPEGHLNVVWLDGHENAMNDSVYYTRSTDGGMTFRSPTRMNAVGDPVSGYPRVAVSPDGTVHAVWQRYNDVTFALNLVYAQSVDGGQTFSTSCPIAGGSPFYQWSPSFAASPNGDLSLAWSDDRQGTFDVFASTIGASTAVGSEGGPRVVWRAAPNPFRDWVGIGPASNGSGTASLLAGFAVIDVRGRHVRAVRASGLPLGWDGRDDQGRQVAPGTYFLRLPGDRNLRVTRLR